MKLPRKLSALVVLGIAFFGLGSVPLPVLAEPEKKAGEKTAAASILRQDSDGVLWFEEGGDGKTEYSSAMVLSAKTDGIVILVSASEKHIKKAVGLAIKMRNALQKREDTPDDIPVVAFKSDRPTVGYRFYTDGLYYGMDNLGIYGPAEAKKHLGKLVTQHHLLKRHVKEGRWGKDHAALKPLQIVSQ